MALTFYWFLVLVFYQSCVLCCFILGPRIILSKKREYYLEDNPKIYTYKLKFERHFSAEFVPTILMVGYARGGRGGWD